MSGRLLALGVPLLLLCGCGSDVVDVPSVETQIRSGLIEQLGDPGITVACPGEREWDTGGSFGCIAEDSEGRSVRVTVYMENDAGDITWAVD